jgi:hypothetical protein
MVYTEGNLQIGGANVTTDQKIQTLMFSSGLVTAVCTFLVALPNIEDTTKIVIGAVVTLLVTVINLALGVFFKVKTPITTALMTPPPNVN